MIAYFSFTYILIRSQIKNISANVWYEWEKSRSQITFTNSINAASIGQIARDLLVLVSVIIYLCATLSLVFY
jgi:hypothetical protein